MDDWLVVVQLSSMFRSELMMPWYSISFYVRPMKFPAQPRLAKIDIVSQSDDDRPIFEAQWRAISNAAGGIPLQAIDRHVAMKKWQYSWRKSGHRGEKRRDISMAPPLKSRRRALSISGILLQIPDTWQSTKLSISTKSILTTTTASASLDNKRQR